MLTQSASPLRAAFALLLAIHVMLAPGGAAADDGDELKARTHFAAGEYKQALDIYARLYAETMHPTYLRNIARCHQNLGNADKAISSFREYLRKARDSRPISAREIEGYIAEMAADEAREDGRPAAARARSRGREARRRGSAHRRSFAGRSAYSSEPGPAPTARLVLAVVAGVVAAGAVGGKRAHRGPQRAHGTARSRAWILRTGATARVRLRPQSACSGGGEYGAGVRVWRAETANALDSRPSALRRSID